MQIATSSETVLGPGFAPSRLSLDSLCLGALRERRQPLFGSGHRLPRSDTTSKCAFQIKALAEAIHRDRQARLGYGKLEAFRRRESQTMSPSCMVLGFDVSCVEFNSRINETKSRTREPQYTGYDL